MSHGYCPYTPVAAVRKAEDILGPNREWRGSPGAQKAWLEAFYGPLYAEVLGIKEIVANATFNPDAHVAWMKEQNWPTERPNLGDGEFVSAACMDLLVHWAVPGYKRPLMAADGKEYAAVALGKDTIEIFETSVGPVACLKTKTGDEVWLHMIDGVTAAGPELAALAGMRFDRKWLKPSQSYDGIVFPMVDFTDKKSLDWLVGLSTVTQGGQPAKVLDAVQRVELKMNHEGARARAADEIRFGITSVRVPPPPLVIDRPFLAAFLRPGLAKPLFAAHLTQDAWKDPGGLGE